MPYIRLSLMDPRSENKAELEQMHQELLRSFKEMPGYLGGYLIVASDESGRIGRLSIWKTQDDADRASQNAHILAVRSEMRYLSDDESALDAVIEQGYDATEM